VLEGGKVTSVGAPDADILLEAIEELRKRITAGAATFLVKVKAHRGEPANEEADIQTDKAMSGKDVPTEWHDRTNRAVFTWQEPRRKLQEITLVCTCRLRMCLYVTMTLNDIYMSNNFVLQRHIFLNNI